jgi:hypothetical protein
MTDDAHEADAALETEAADVYFLQALRLGEGRLRRVKPCSMSKEGMWLRVCSKVSSQEKQKCLSLALSLSARVV